jgi:hypothetical protein
MMGNATEIIPLRFIDVQRTINLRGPFLGVTEVGKEEFCGHLFKGLGMPPRKRANSTPDDVADRLAGQVVKWRLDTLL